MGDMLLLWMLYGLMWCWWSSALHGLGFEVFGFCDMGLGFGVLGPGLRIEVLGSKL